MLNKLKQMIDEANYPYFTDQYLTRRLDGLSNDQTIDDLALELLMVKSGIEEIKLGDITIKSPSAYFRMLADDMRIKIKTNKTIDKNRKSKSRTMVRADGRK